MRFNKACSWNNPLFELNWFWMLTFLICLFADIAPNYNLTGVKLFRNNIMFIATFSLSWFSRQLPLCTITREPYVPLEMSSFGLLQQLHSSPPFSPSPAGLTQKMFATSFVPWHTWGQSYLGAASFLHQTCIKPELLKDLYLVANRGVFLEAFFKGAKPREEVRRQLWGSYGTSILL